MTVVSRNALRDVRSDDVTDIRLRLQRLSGPMQALAVAALAAMQSSDGTFTTQQVASLLSRLRLPAQSNLSTTLGRHRTTGLLMRPSDKTWAITPAGEFRLADQAGHVQPRLLAAELDDFGGSELAGRRHNLIPPFLAPAGTEVGLRRLLGSSSFETNVMLVTRFPRDEADSFHELIGKIRSAARAHGLVLQVASDRNAEDMLWANVVTHMWGSKYAIVLMDSADGVLNSNVLIEIGGLITTGRRCAIFRDESVPTMPTDLVGHIYKPVSLNDHAQTIATVHSWIRDDLGMASCDDCPG